MFQISSRARILAVALLAPLIGFVAACGSDANAPDTNADGIRFDYTGVLNGTYHASGQPTRLTTSFLTSADYATAMSYLPTELNRAGTISVLANEVSFGSYGNFVAMNGVPAKVGTVQVSNFAGFAFYRRLQWNANFFGADSIFSLETGEITVTDYSETRVRGTFHGIARLRVAYQPVGYRDSLIITNGRFNLAMNDTAATDFRCRLFLC